MGAAMIVGPSVTKQHLLLASPHKQVQEVLAAAQSPAPQEPADASFKSVSYCQGPVLYSGQHHLGKCNVATLRQNRLAQGGHRCLQDEMTPKERKCQMLASPNSHHEPHKQRPMH